MFPSLNGVDLTAGRAANGDRCGMIALVWGERGAAWGLSWRPRPYRPSGKGHAAPVPADLNQRPSAPRGSVPITSDQSASQGQNRFIESQWSRPVPPGRSLSAGMLPGHRSRFPPGRQHRARPGSERRDAPANPSSNSARSRCPLRPSPVFAAIAFACLSKASTTPGKMTPPRYLRPIQIPREALA